MKKLLLITLTLLAASFAAGELFTPNQAKACGPHTKCLGYVFQCFAACDGEVKEAVVCTSSNFYAQGHVTNKVCECYAYDSPEYNKCARSIACTNTGVRCKF